MNNFQDIRYLLRKLQSENYHLQSVVMKEIAAAIQGANKSDLLELLEFLISTHDVEIQVKLFSVLAAYLVTDITNYDIIATYSPLYDTIQNLLLRGTPQKVTAALNFILALLSFDTEDMRTLNSYSRNMIRVSGCLNALAQMFASGLMYQDTWIVLCQSLAAACRNSEVNQSYCSHLVPLCVQKCRQGNVEACAVLHSLLCNHERNTQLFLDNNGTDIFTRQMLSYDMCMQLLVTIVKKSERAVMMLRKTDVIHHLRDFFKLHGPYSQMGQWSTIILYHLNFKNSEEKLSLINISKIPKDIHTVNSMQKKLCHDLQNSKRIGNSTLTKQVVKSNVIENNYYDPVVKSMKDVNISSQLDLQSAAVDNLNSEETRNLFQNVIKEVIYWNAKNMDNFRRPLRTVSQSKHHSVQYIRQTPISNKCEGVSQWLGEQNKNKEDKTMSYTSRQSQRNAVIRADKFNPKNVNKVLQDTNNRIINNSFGSSRRIFLQNKRKLYKHNEKATNVVNSSVTFNDDDLTFSFLENSEAFNHVSVQRNKQLTDYISTGSISSCGYKEMKTYTSDYLNTSNLDNTMELRDFRPPFVSTPKNIKKSKIDEAKSSLARHHSLKKNNYLNKQEKAKTLVSSNKEIKHRSMSARLFSAINESCTTFVKSVKSIFGAKKDGKHENKIDKMNEEKNNGNASCSYSFTNYMRKRDALLENEHSTQNDDTHSVAYKVNSCKTCKDTIVLQNKMARSESLRQTVKKLKIGLNLYGCDFRKISKVLWPRDRYMTPELLHNLYRKLIVKGGHKNHEFRQKALNAKGKK